MEEKQTEIMYEWKENTFFEVIRWNLLHGRTELGPIENSSTSASLAFNHTNLNRTQREKIGKQTVKKSIWSRISSSYNVPIKFRKLIKIISISISFDLLKT